MKIHAFLFLACLLLPTACSRPTETQNQESASPGNDPNVALSDQLDEVHMDLMNKMETLYNLKTSLRALKELPATTPDLNLKYDSLIFQLDSADHAMGKWMHTYTKPADTVNQESARTYLENEIDKLNKVKSLMEESIAHANEALNKK